MPASAYGLLALFTAVSVGAGLLAARLVGPRRPWTPLLPSLAAFGALYLVGHRLPIRIGPTVEILGWNVSLAFDLLVAVGAALLAGVGQLAGVHLLQAKQRRTGRDRLA